METGRQAGGNEWVEPTPFCQLAVNMQARIKTRNNDNDNDNDNDAQRLFYKKIMCY